jgi:hypothetical protein
MLTLLETTNAIKALDTDKDVIINACIEMLISHYHPDGERNESSVSKAIVKTYAPLLQPEEFLFCAARVLSLSAIILVKEGAEAEMLSTLHKMIHREYMGALIPMLKKRFEKDPAKALQGLMTMIRTFHEEAEKSKG